MMKTDNKKHFAGSVLVLGLLILLFGYLHSRGLSTVSAALVLVCGRSLFRFLFALANLLLTVVFIVAILGCIIF